MSKMRGLILTFALMIVFSALCALVCTQDAKAEGEGSAYGDLLSRIEALESRPTGNVTAPKIRGVKMGINIRHRFEAWDNEVRDGTAYGLGTVTLQADGTLQRSQGAGTSTGDQQHSVGRQETREFTLQWMRLTLDADVSKNVRAYVELADVRTFGEEQSTVGNLNRTDVQEAYVELRNLGDLTPILKNIELRVGRWRAAYGNHRLIGALPWANQTRGYDGARLQWKNKESGNFVDLFAWQIQEKESGGANGGTLGSWDAADSREEVLYGIYTHFKVVEGLVIEPYTIVRARSAEDTQPAVAAVGGTGATSEQRYTYGFRLDGRKIPGLGGTDFTIEPAWQRGHTDGLRASDVGNVARGKNSNVSNSINAFAIYAGAGYTFTNCPWTPRIGVAYSFASGDKRPYGGGSKTFDHLYPTGHAHNGFMDMFAWQNIEDYQIHFSVKPSKKLVVDLRAHFISLDEESDNMYGVAGGTGYGGGMSVRRTGSDTAIVNGSTIRVDDTVGQEIDLTVKYKMFDNFMVVGGYSHFFADDFLKDTGNGLDDRGIDWAYLMTTVKF